MLATIHVAITGSALRDWTFNRHLHRHSLINLEERRYLRNIQAIGSSNRFRRDCPAIADGFVTLFIREDNIKCNAIFVCWGTVEVWRVAQNGQCKARVAVKLETARIWESIIPNWLVCYGNFLKNIDGPAFCD